MCEKEKLFLELIEGFHWKYNNNKEDVLYAYKQNEFIFFISLEGLDDHKIDYRKIISSYRLNLKQDLKKTTIYPSYNNILLIFKNKFGMKYSEIYSFLIDMFNKHLNFYNFFISM